MISSGKHLGNSIMRGTMWLVSTYPAFIRSDELSDDVNDYRFELYEVSDDVYERVRSMELGAGYDEETYQFTEVSSGKLIEAIYYPANEKLQDYCKRNRPVIPHY